MKPYWLMRELVKKVSSYPNSLEIALDHPHKLQGIIQRIISIEKVPMQSSINTLFFKFFW